MLVLATSLVDVYPTVKEMEDIEYSGLGKARFVSGVLNRRPVSIGVLDTALVDQAPAISYAASTFGFVSAVVLGVCHPSDNNLNVGDIAIGSCISEQGGEGAISLDAGLRRQLLQCADRIVGDIVWVKSFVPKVAEVNLVEPEQYDLAKSNHPRTARLSTERMIWCVASACRDEGLLVSSLNVVAGNKQTPSLAGRERIGRALANAILYRMIMTTEGGEHHGHY